MSGEIWQQITCRPLVPGLQPALSTIDLQEAEPDVEHQISEAENDWIIRYFRQFHLPIFQSTGISLDDLRILEVGAGFGQLAYGTARNVCPKFYTATDIFPQLVSKLDENFKKWEANNFVAALLDPNKDDIHIKDGAFNVIQSHSVLHHILRYEDALARLYGKLDSPGVMVFCEPCLDAYVYFQTLTKAFRREAKISNELKDQLHYLDIYIDQRCGSERRNADFLAQFGAGDKYLYSPFDLQDIAEKLGANLHVWKDKRKARGNFRFELSIRGASEEELLQFDALLDEILPTGVDEAYFADLRQVFSLTKF
ncbi:class I SAM-dependent methyltransferase [Cupriavidus taiwanensis]|uniref:class I SAM-dependent methyltransferase n=1 Tax=Cupriavidus taiwanensis TaxID=164546 RepID=UPI000E11B4F0|nr:class I SAM-dependent methyltransferase [Cupriavidus taiwanensis]SPA44874.1 hypothetical protein CBM2629_A170101 [Cupriavidus taiwanensis]